MLSEPVAPVLGAMLRDARERRLMLPDQPAELLGLTPAAVLALEAGQHPINAAVITQLTRLYRCGQDEWALQKLLAHSAAQMTTAWDGELGHARRLAACLRTALRVRWLATVLLPAPLQTRDYARAVAEHSTLLRGAPVPAAAVPLYVLDARVIHRGSGTARLMAEQVTHLLHLADSGTEIRVIGQDHPDPQPPGHLIEMELPGGRVLARPDSNGVHYHPGGNTLLSQLDAAVAATDPHSTHQALVQAAESHRLLAETGLPRLSQQNTTEEAADAP